MKNVFGIGKDIFNDESSIFEYDGGCFVIKTVDEETTELLDSVCDEFENHKKQASLPLWLNIIKFVATIGALLIGGSILKADVTLAEAYSNAPYFFFICGALAVIAIVLWTVERVKYKKIVTSEKFKSNCEVAECAITRARNHLGVPENALSVDVFAFVYKDKKGTQVSAMPYTFFPCEMMAYCDSDNFYLADVKSVLSFPRSNILGIEQIKKKATLGNWNKSDAPRSKKYKQYKMVVDNMSLIHIKSYYSMKLRQNGEDYEILFPAYDVESIAQMLELRLFKNT